ncbi:MAG: hypothetical protein M1816_002385 [Peltula sp. TS41687]|nr:MAG: hypothetical protein M1816_002385 [Peltula sp. TS41687]
MRLLGKKRMLPAYDGPHTGISIHEMKCQLFVPRSLIWNTPDEPYRPPKDPYQGSMYADQPMRPLPRIVFPPTPQSIEPPKAMCLGCVLQLAKQPELVYHCDCRHEFPCARCRRAGENCRPAPREFQEKAIHTQLNARAFNEQHPQSSIKYDLMISLRARVKDLDKKLKAWTENKMYEVIAGMDMEERHDFFDDWQIKIWNKSVDESTKKLFEDCKKTFLGTEMWWADGTPRY